MQRRNKRGLGWGTLAACFGLLGCGTSFDTIGQLDGLRVLGVQKSNPMPRPGETVELKMLVHDTGPADEEEETREPVQVVWLSGCVNPPADLYQGCFAQFGQVLGGLGLDPTQPIGGGTDAENAALLLQLAQAGIGLGLGDTFQTAIPEDLISRRPTVSGIDPYGLSYVFFAACAGTLLPDTSAGGFPVTCEDKDGQRVPQREFVAGYTSMYSYLNVTNRNPGLLGYRVADRAVEGDSVCLGAECEDLAWDAPRKCDGNEPKVDACGDERKPETCPKLKFNVRVDPDSVDPDPVLSRDIGVESTEQMWVNFHADRGQFRSDVALVNDSESGFKDSVEGEFIAPEAKGKTHIWTVVRDNRGGTAWGRFDICVK